MTAITLIACQGRWPGFPCRGKFLAGTSSVDEARAQAAAAGWLVGAVDLCPAHVRRHQRGSGPLMLWLSVTVDTAADLVDGVAAWLRVLAALLFRCAKGLAL